MEMGIVAAELQTARNIAALVAIAVVTNAPARNVRDRREADGVRLSDVSVISSSWMWFTKLLAQ